MELIGYEPITTATIQDNLEASCCSDHWPDNKLFAKSGCFKVSEEEEAGVLVVGCCYFNIIAERRLKDTLLQQETLLCRQECNKTVPNSSFQTSTRADNVCQQPSHSTQGSGSAVTQVTRAKSVNQTDAFKLPTQTQSSNSMDWQNPNNMKDLAHITMYWEVIRIHEQLCPSSSCQAESFQILRGKQGTELQDSCTDIYLAVARFSLAPCMHLQSRSFNLIDEGVAANNPTQVAITHIFNQIVKGNFENVDIKPMDTTMILGVSLGTGTARFEAKYNVTMVAEWSPVNWIFDKGATP
ncbi:hypothetical protein ACET3Z_027542 [Daucus carota]